MITIEKVDFIGIPVLDPPAADAYYGEVFGLFERNPRSTERWIEYEAPNVTLALVPNAYTRREHRPLSVGALAVRVDDVDKERERLAAAGVEFIRETIDSGVCNGAAFTGLDGNGMLLHRRYAPFADGRSPEAATGRVDFVTVPMQDREALLPFYGETLGLERNPHTGEDWVEYETGNVTLALDESPFDPTPLPGGTIAFRVSDVEAAKAELEAAGVKFPAGVIDSGVCHIAPFSDPEGNGLMLHRRHAPFSDGTMP